MSTSRHRSASPGDGRAGSRSVEPVGRRIIRAALQLAIWALGVIAAALWLSLLARSHFSSVAVALGLLCAIAILR